MGIGCRRDPLEANVWYVKAADHGDERARHRIAAIRAAAAGGGSGVPIGQLRINETKNGAPNKEEEEKVKRKWGIFG